MDYLSKQINLKNIFYSGSPGIISIFLTFLSIPIYLKYLPPTYYSSFLISHIFMSLSLVFNFNIGKVASIKIQNKKKEVKNQIIVNALFLSFLIGVLSSVVIVFFLINIFKDENELNFFLIFIGLITSILFINVESITKGLGKFKITAITNLFFYGFSISGPAFVVFLNINNNSTLIIDLFLISVLFKIGSLIFIIISIKNFLKTRKTINKKIVFSFRNQSFWMTLSNSYNQIFDYLDKYLIKLFLSPIVFINYTIAQQISSKLSIFSNAITSVILPKLASQKKTINKSYVLNFHLFLFYISFSIFFILFDALFDDLLLWWLKDNFNDKFFDLFNIFLLLTFIACQSHIIISLYEANEISRINSIFESIIIIPFIAFLFFIISEHEVIYLCYLILFKEILLFLIRSFYIKKFIIYFKLYITSIILFSFYWIVNINEMYKYAILAKFLFIVLILFLIGKLHKKFKYI